MKKLGNAENKPRNKKIQQAMQILPLYTTKSKQNI